MDKNKLKSEVERFKKVVAEGIKQGRSIDDPQVFLFGDKTMGVIPLNGVPKRIWKEALEKVLGMMKPDYYVVLSEGWMAVNPKNTTTPRDLPPDDRYDIAMIVAVDRKGHTVSAISKIQTNPDDSRTLGEWDQIESGMRRTIKARYSVE